MKQMTKKSIIKWVIIILAVGGLAAGGTWLAAYISSKAAMGSIEYGKEYYLKQLRPQTFFTDDGTAIDLIPNSNSYFKVNEDKKTGIFAFVEAGEEIKFIVSDYKTTNEGTTFAIEYIKGDKIIMLTALSNETAITFKALAIYNVSVTTEQPNDISQITHDVPVMVFTRGEK
jgi:hypothetical protein